MLSVDFILNFGAVKLPKYTILKFKGMNSSGEMFIWTKVYLNKCLSDQTFFPRTYKLCLTRSCISDNYHPCQCLLCFFAWLQYICLPYHARQEPKDPNTHCFSLIMISYYMNISAKLIFKVFSKTSPRMNCLIYTAP